MPEGGDGDHAARERRRCVRDRLLQCYEYSDHPWPPRRSITISQCAAGMRSALFLHRFACFPFSLVCRFFVQARCRSRSLCTCSRISLAKTQVRVLLLRVGSVRRHQRHVQGEWSGAWEPHWLVACNLRRLPVHARSPLCCSLLRCVYAHWLAR